MSAGRLSGLADLADADLDALDVAADLTIAREGETIRIEAYTDRVFVTLPSVGMALSALRRHRKRASLLAALLSSADLTVVVRVGDADVARLGADAEPGRLARRVVPGIEMLPAGVALAVADGLA